ncbi:MAG: ABC transporter permease [Desulfovibrionaceae bacterium CG1_02_65_16]|nr:MAG: ABC transporter permease [Desulfovibrionaceae bacterium CG1_02_65_16]
MLLDLKIARASLSAHKLRAVLAMLGVFLGALSFNGVQHVSQAMYRNAEVEAEKLGPGLFAALAGQVRFSHGGARDQNIQRNFTVGDASALADGVPGVLALAPFFQSAMPIRSGGVTVTTQLVGTWPQYQRVRSFQAEYGRFLQDDDVRDMARVVVLGRKIAERLFGTPEAALGREVQVFRARFAVVGVMEAKGRDLTGTDQDEQTFLPLSTFLRRAANQTWISGAYLKLAEGVDIGQTRDAASQVLRRRHHLEGAAAGGGKADDFSLLTPADAMQLRREALDLVQTLGLITSFISFAVGAMGILSIMVLMVQARRMEIGIRRAVGGSRGRIMRQFLLEAGIMAGLGGTLGVCASLGLVELVCALAGFPYVLLPGFSLGVMAGSVLLGLAAGAYPARQAAGIEILKVLSSQG